MLFHALTVPCPQGHGVSGLFYADWSENRPPVPICPFKSMNESPPNKPARRDAGPWSPKADHGKKKQCINSGVMAGVTGESRAGSSGCSRRRHLLSFPQTPGAPPSLGSSCRSETCPEAAESNPESQPGASFPHRRSRRAPAQRTHGAAPAVLHLPLFQGGVRLEPHKHCLGTGRARARTWVRQSHFFAAIYCHISSRITSILQRKLKTTKKSN